MLCAPFWWCTTVLGAPCKLCAINVDHFTCAVFAVHRKRGPFFCVEDLEFFCGGEKDAIMPDQLWLDCFAEH